jgi:lactoylglutathione lyase
MYYRYTGIRVRNLQRSLLFYTRVIGMKINMKGKMGHGGVWVELKSSGSSQRLELNYYPPGSKFHEKFKTGSELDHLAFWVKDVDAKYEQLLKKGARKAVEPFPQGKYRFAFVKDPDGIWIELIGIAKRQSQELRKAPS